jgi:hypothetical protein
MPTPSLFPIFLKAQAGGGTVAAGTVYVETFGAELLEMIEVELVEMDIDVEIVENVPDAEILETIDVEIVC